jgi:hypothetical protein
MSGTRPPDSLLLHASAHPALAHISSDEESDAEFLLEINQQKKGFNEDDGRLSSNPFISHWI